MAMHGAMFMFHEVIIYSRKHLKLSGLVNNTVCNRHTCKHTIYVMMFAHRLLLTK